MDKLNKHFRPSDLRIMRENAGLTQVDVAKLMGVDAATVSMVETGKNRNPITIALFLHVLNPASVSDTSLFSLEFVLVVAGVSSVVSVLFVVCATAFFV